MKRQKIWYGILVLALALIASCSHEPVQQMKREALRESAARFPLGDAGSVESLDSLLDSALLYCNSLAPSTEFVFGDLHITALDYRFALEHLRAQLKQDPTKQLFLDTLRAGFTMYQANGSGSWGALASENYVTPNIKATSRRAIPYIRALYGVPKDLLKIRLDSYASKFENLVDLPKVAQENGRSQLFGRLIDSKEKREGTGSIVPYFTREEIDGKSILSRAGLEIAWVEPRMAYLAHEVGSVELEFSSGKRILLAQAANNGHKHFRAEQVLGKYSRGRMLAGAELAPTQKSSAPIEYDPVLIKNPYYAFFRKTEGEIPSRMGVPLVSHRSLALDYRFYPRGALAFIAFGAEEEKAQHTQVVGALEEALDPLGGDSARLYLGREADSGDAADFRGPAWLYFLAPKESLLVSLRMSRAADGQSGFGVRNSEKK